MKNPFLDIVKNFLKALENGESGNQLEKFYHPQATQVEFPNILTKTLIKRDLNALKVASEKGKQVISKQSYEMTQAYIQENTVIIEAIWSGQLAIPLGKLQAGDEMKAYFAQFFEFKDNKILKQRNYDCFEPF